MRACGCVQQLLSTTASTWSINTAQISWAGLVQVATQYTASSAGVGDAQGVHTGTQQAMQDPERCVRVVYIGIAVLDVVCKPTLA